MTATLEPGATGGAPPAYAREYTELRLGEIWAKILKTEAVGVHEDFFESGGDSVQLVELQAQIEKEFGIELDGAVLWEQRTIEAQAKALVEEKFPRQNAGPLLLLQPFGSRPPIFFVHTHGGTVSYCVRLAKHLGSGQPSYGLQNEKLEEGRAYLSIAEMARDYASALRSVQREGPYHLFGYCSGGIIAYEIAQQLAASGQEIGFLGLMDAPAPGAMRLGWGGLWFQMARRAESGWKKLKTVGGKERMRVLGKKLRSAGRLIGEYAELERWHWRLRRQQGRKDALIPQGAEEVRQVNLAVMRDYRPAGGTAVPITYFNSRDLDDWFSIGPVEGWNSVAGQRVEVMDLPRGKTVPMDDRQAALIAERIQKRVREGAAHQGIPRRDSAGKSP